ncbi:hypothetical protein AVEN_68576-1 [Araneus ventricosus]|uniref:Uncharacterized protein n=1 Tax=Araneus ventricosus TaxID=182803 RepID=A0A4Y2ULZ6_ARAVE|nr:hypothetical protein AVEN_8575-1 [Araneus ventricosus]GBO13890.1 hypothetical protein AVEN_68576-1 [Araneus ventricosus]
MTSSFSNKSDILYYIQISLVSHSLVKSEDSEDPDTTLDGRFKSRLHGRNPDVCCSSPQLDQVQESARPQENDAVFKTVGERFMVKEESAASVGTRPWTPEGRSLTLSIAFML